MVGGLCAGVPSCFCPSSHADTLAGRRDAPWVSPTPWVLIPGRPPLCEASPEHSAATNHQPGSHTHATAADYTHPCFRRAATTTTRTNQLRAFLAFGATSRPSTSSAIPPAAPGCAGSGLALRWPYPRFTPPSCLSPLPPSPPPPLPPLAPLPLAPPQPAAGAAGAAAASLPPPAPPAPSVLCCLACRRCCMASKALALSTLLR